VIVKVFSMERDLVPPPEYIDLVSDDEDFDFIDHEENILDRYFDGPVRRADEYLDESSAFSAPGSPRHTAENPIDLTGLDNTANPNSPPAPSPRDTSMTIIIDQAPAAGEIITEAACLQMVLSILPDVSIKHVLGLIHTTTKDQTLTSAECERIITQLLDSGEYPKEQDVENGRKRKRSDEDDDDDDLSDFERGTKSAGYSLAYDSDA
jgi:TRIAD3 protein (E3 ubiquitin-protein ligase RNF216)